MRLIICSVLLFFSLPGVAQGVVSFPELNVLYKAYDNIVVFGAGKKTKSLVLESDESAISKLTDSTYLVRVTTTNRTAKINVRNKWTHKIVTTYVFRIMLLPKALIYWGNYPPGSQITLDQSILHADYGEDIFWTNSELEIQSYEINSPFFEEPLKISGGLIKSEVIEALKRAKSMNNGETITLELVAQVRGKDQVLRVGRASFVY